MWGDIMATPKPDYEARIPIAPNRKEAIKNLRMIADDIERGYSGFDCFVDYDFVHITQDIEAGAQNRKAKNDGPMKMVMTSQMPCGTVGG